MEYGLLRMDILMNGEEVWKMNFADTQKHIKISKKRFCKNGKPMRRKNYWKAVYMDSSIASRNKHLL